MNSAEQVSKAVEALKNNGLPLSEVAWQTAILCVGWAYVFGARGQYCTPANRRARYSDEHETIKTKCKNFDGKGSAGCAGCKWYPGGEYTRFFDCRGFTYWILKLVFNWELMGAGATSQWNNANNWKAKGEVSDGIPQDVIVCVFYYKKDSNGKRTKTLAHTGLYYNGETCECSNGVQHSTTLNKKWDVWGVPACVDGDIPAGNKPTLRKGDSGQWVTLAQTELIQQGYDCGSTGADGKFGKNTEAAVKRFQLDHNLTPDGVIGDMTWNALDGAQPATKYTVNIPGLTATQADALLLQYPGATKTEERG